MKFWHVALGATIVASKSLTTASSVHILNRDLEIVQSPPDNSSTDLGIPVTPIDPRFQITRSIGPGAPLAQNSLLVTAVNEMTNLALRDWNGRVQSFRSERIPGYTDVSIVMRTVPPAQQFYTRVAVWGLYAAIDSMRLQNRFVVGEYQLYWDGSMVATLRIKTNTALRSTIGGQRNESESQDEMLPTLPGVANSSQNLTRISPSSAEVSAMLNEDVFVANCHYTQRAQSLSFEEVFLPIICALRDMAAVSSTSYLDERFTVQPVGIDAKLLFGGRNLGPISSRNNYQYQWAIEALNVIPRFLLMEHRFAEMYVNIIVNNAYLGVVGLGKGSNLAEGIGSTS